MFFNKSVKRIVITGLMAGVLVYCTAYASSEDTKVEMDEVSTMITDYESIMDTAHAMAENARSLGEEEDSEIILIAQEYYNDAKTKLITLQNEYEALSTKYQEQLAEEAAAKTAYVESQRYTYNVFSITGLSAEQFNQLLAPYALAGNGQALYDMEQTYGVNGIFCMAVANVESSLGGYSPSRSSHNYWGILGNSWSSDYEGIMGFGNYIANSGYYNNKSIESIARIYCPPTSSQWAADVKSFMYSFWSKV